VSEDADTITFKTRGRNERFEYQGVLTPVDGVDAVFGVEHETARLRTISPGSAAEIASVGLTSGYAQLSVGPAKGLRLTGGIRHDDHETFGGSTILSANGVFSPNDGATTLRASYGEGFKAPSLFQLYSQFGNTALEPERSRSYDVGVVQRLVDGRLQVGATWFARSTRNQIDFLSCFLNTEPLCTNRPSGVYANLRRTRAEGVEAMIEMTPVDAMTLKVQYSLIDTENRDTGLDLARRPRQTATALIDYRWPFGLQTGATVAHVGSSFDNAANTRALEGYVLVDLRAALPITDLLEVYGRVENVFDERYQTIFQYGSPGRAAYAGVRLTL
jgi:vitamin B12 transporter